MEGPAREVRKTVTILFCDLVHSTGLVEGVDPEAYRLVQSRFFETMRDVVEQHGGTVEKFIGDEVMAVFGVPAVHEDDALRAVRAAAQMRQRIQVLNEELEPRGIRLQVRIGVNTGEVIALDHTHGEGYVSGEPVIVAKRLEQAAEPDEILIGKATYPLVRHAITAGPLERIAVKGKHEDVGRRRVDEVDRDAPGVARRLDAPIVGRDEELRLLRAAFERTVEERSCRLFTVLGPAGIGKSRLVRELVAVLGERATTAIGRCLPYGDGITFWPLTDVLQSVGGVDAIAAALEGAEHREAVIELLAGVTGASGSLGSSEETFWAVRRAFEALARERPLVVCFEDVHWAEPTLLDLIEYVAGWWRGAPMFVVCLARPDLVEKRPTWIAPQPHADALALDPLPAASVETLLDRLTGATRPSAAFRKRIQQAAGGNPLFLEQIAAVSAERNGEGEFSIPPSIHGLLAERLDRLTEEERAVIERASVIGRDFALEAVAELSQPDRRGAIAGHLLALVRKGLVRPDPRRSTTENRFSFHHILLRDTAYKSIPKQLRARLHEGFADWLERTLEQDAPHEIVGYHLEEAYRYRVELGVEDKQARELARRAGARLAEAGRRAYTRDDAAAASSLLGRAIELLPESDPKRLRLLVLLGGTTFEAGETSRALKLLGQAQASAAATGQRGIELRARVKELGYRLTTAPAPDAAAVLAEAQAAISELEQLRDDESLLAAWWLVGRVGMFRSRNSLREEAAGHALELAHRAGLRREAVWAANWLVASLAYGPTHVVEAIARAEHALAQFPETHLGKGALGLLYAFAGRDAQAEETIARARQAQLELGHRMQYASDSMNVGWIALLAGRSERAEQELREGAEILEAAGERGWFSGVALVLAEVLYRLGREGEAEEWTRKGEEAASADDVTSQALWRAIRAKLLARRGRAEDAIRLSQEAVEKVRQCDDLHLLGDCLADQAQVLGACGRADEARRVLEEALAVYERKGIAPSIERTRALISEPARR